MSRSPRSSAPARTSSARPLSEEETLVGDETFSAVTTRPRHRGDRVGRYFLLDVVGEGAMGRVFRAYDPDLDRRIAIKLLFGTAPHDAAEPDRYLQEAQAMARIDHPNVVTVYDVGMHEGSVFIAMELVDGPALDRWLRTEPSPRRILDVLLEAARGVAAAHAAGVVHRDFKPGNVLVTRDGHAKVGDFGLAGLDEVEGPRPEGETGGQTIGTPAYMSPEHITGARIDARSDQFSYAITLYEALYGERPFRAQSWPELVDRVLSGDLEPSAASRRGAINRVIRRALSVDPAQRFDSMDELIARVERIRRPRWPRWLLAGGLVLAVVFADEAPDPAACDSGAHLVATSWSPEARAAVRVGGREFTPAFARQARARFEAALDDYATRWAEAYDTSCAVVGPRAADGTPAERMVAQCLDNRLDSLRGLVEFAAAEPIDAGRVDELTALPPIEDCTTDRWVPYPSDPDRAARAARLHRSIARIRMARLAEHDDAILEQSQAVVEEARALGDPYLLARVLSEHARVVDDQGEPQAATAILDEALRVALAGGYDLLAANVINDMLLNANRLRSSSDAVLRLGIIARGLVERAGGDHVLLGNIALNEGNNLRHAGRFEETAVRDEEAARHFAAAGNEEGRAKAALNQAVTGLAQGRFEEMERPLAEAVAAIERTIGESSPNAFTARKIVVQVATYRGQTQRAFSLAAESFARAREAYAPGSHTLRDATILHAVAALHVGQLDVADQMIALARGFPGTTAEERGYVELLALLALQTRKQQSEVLRVIADARARVAGGPVVQRAWVELERARALYLLERPEEARQALGDPLILQVLGQNDSEGFVASTALLAVLLDVPCPAAATWQELIGDEGTKIWITARIVELVEAFETDTDARRVARRIRDALADRYFGDDVAVQLIDAWLSAPDPS